MDLKFAEEKRDVVGVLRSCEFMVDYCAEAFVCGDLFHYFIVDREWECSGVTVVVRRT